MHSALAPATSCSLMHAPELCGMAHMGPAARHSPPGLRLMPLQQQCPSAVEAPLDRALAMAWPAALAPAIHWPLRCHAQQVASCSRQTCFLTLECSQHAHNTLICRLLSCFTKHLYILSQLRCCTQLLESAWHAGPDRLHRLQPACLCAQVEGSLHAKCLNPARCNRRSKRMAEDWSQLLALAHQADLAQQGGPGQLVTAGMQDLSLQPGKPVLPCPKTAARACHYLTAGGHAAASGKKQRLLLLSSATS